MWVLFIVSLPGANQAARMRLWRGMKASGAAVLRDGVYLLPDTASLYDKLEQQAQAVREHSGTAYVLRAVQGPAVFTTLFNRTREYAEALRAADALQARLDALTEAEAWRALRTLKRDMQAIFDLDFFPDEARERAGSTLAALEAAIVRRFSPGEPQPAERTVERLHREDYQGRLWATRQRLWVDRVASAWLIRRFIDPDARFLWLSDPGQCPSEALGFDFDGATFTHVGDKVTFEVLLDSFGLDQGPGLSRLAALVHDADVGGLNVAETAGLETILAGARSRCADDKALLEVMTPVLDALHAGYQTAKE